MAVARCSGSAMRSERLAQRLDLFGPFAKGFRAVDSVDVWPLRIQGVGFGGSDHRLDQARLATEVVVQLALAGFGAMQDVIDGGRSDAVLEHQLQRCSHDPLSARSAPRRQLGRNVLDHR
jgi:hypothetical protein